MFYTLTISAARRYCRADTAADALAIFRRAFSHPEHGEPDRSTFPRDAIHAGAIHKVDHLPEFAHGYDSAADTSDYIEPRTAKDKAHVSRKTAARNTATASGYLAQITL